MDRRVPAMVVVGIAGAALGLRSPPGASAPSLAGALIAHRAGAPENTLAAVDRAAADGADGVELDVRWGPDGEVVCAHDADQAPGAPALGAMLDRALLHGLLVELDVKTGWTGDRGLVDVVTGAIAARDARDRAWVTAFQPITAWQVRRADPSVALGWPISSTGWAPVDAALAWDGVARWLGASVLEPADAVATDARLDRWAARGWPLEVWTVDDPARVRDLRSRGMAVVVDRVK